MHATVIHSIHEIPAREWNRVSGIGHPFLRHEFLAALETHGCVGEEPGWIPQHVVVYDGKQLAGLAPLYRKDNSYGEFVFDWAWADAYQQNGLDYYPKLVTSIPFTPAQGPRLLASTNHMGADGKLIDAAVIKNGLIKALLTYAENNT